MEQSEWRERLRRSATLGPSRVDHIPSFRIALGLALPLTVVLLLGHPEWAMYASFGAFTGIYSRYETTKMRVRRQLIMGVILTVCVGIGATVSHVRPQLTGAWHEWVPMVVSALVTAVVGTFVMRSHLKPPGAIFPLFAVSAVSFAPSFGPVWLALLVAALSAGWCVLLGFLGHWVGENHSAPGSEVRASTYSWAQLRREFMLFLGAALVAGGAATIFGLPYPYWAQLAAIVPVPVIGRGAKIERGIHRMIGTYLGVGVAAFLLSFPTQPWQLVVWVVVLQFLTEMFVLRNYAFSLVFITPLALLMIQLAHPVEVGASLQARVLETTIGTFCGLGFLLVSSAMHPLKQIEKLGDRVGWLQSNEGGPGTRS